MSLDEKMRLSSVLSFQKKFINPTKDIKTIVSDVVSNYDTNFKSVSIGNQILKQLLFSSLFGIPMSLECQKDVFRLTKQRVIKVATSFPAFHHLSHELQQNCLKSNISMLIAVRAATTANSGKPEDHMKRSCGPEDSEMAKRLIAEVAKERPPRHSLKIVSRNQNFEFCDKRSKERYESVKSTVRKNVGYDPNLVILLSYISLFSCNHGTILSGRNEIKQLHGIQENLVLMLQRYIYAINPEEDASSRFTKAMETLVELNEVPHIFKNLKMT